MPIVDFDPEKVGTTSPHYLSGEKWRVQLVTGLNSVTDEEAKNLKEFDGIEIYLSSGAIAFRETPDTVFQRRTELEALYESNGEKAIAEVALRYRIKKPATGWRDAIQLIIDYEQSHKG